MDKLKTALIQSDLVWENPKQNLINFSEKIDKINQDVDLIILPEMFTTGFTMNPGPVAETMEGKTIKWMQKIASDKQSAITGSIIIKDNNLYYNRLLFAHPSGKIEYYDKRHTFTFAGEDKIFASGDKKLIVNYKGWKLCPLVCYDLRFPVWARNVENYDVLFYSANWPKPRVNAWNALLKARAIENMCYCIGVNRIGVDFLNNEYSGHSVVFDVLGKKISSIKPSIDQIEVVELNKNHINSNREKFQFLNDRDTFSLE